MKKDIEKIYSDAIAACLPDSVVRDAVAKLPHVKGKLYSVAIGKAAWKMSSTAAEELGKFFIVNRDKIVKLRLHNRSTIIHIKI